MIAEEIAFRARALAQAHPMSAAGAAARDRLVSPDGDQQAMPELVSWAKTAVLVGYCVRRVEEVEALGTGAAMESVDILDAEVERLAEAMRAGEPVGLLDDGVVVATLDRVIASEIDKRAEHIRPAVGEEQWAAFEEYVAWWVVRGYALRSAEVRWVAAPEPATR